MKSKSKNIEKVFLKLLNNKISLYLVSLVAILVIINNLMNDNYVAVFIFYIIAGLVFLYTKNMTLIFLVSLIGTSIYLNYKNVIFVEGFKENQDNIEEDSNDVEEDLDDLNIDPDDNVYYHDYSSDSEEEYETDNEEEFEKLKKEKMYEGYSGRNTESNQKLQAFLNGAVNENNGYLDNSPPSGLEHIGASIWTKLKKPINFPQSNINPVPGKIANGDFIPEEKKDLKVFNNRIAGFEGFTEGVEGRYLNPINSATIGGVTYPGGVGSSPEIRKYKKRLEAIEQSKKNYKNVEGFKEGATSRDRVGLKADKQYLQNEAEKKVMKKGESMSSGRNLKKLQDDYEDNALTVERGLTSGKNAQRATERVQRKIRNDKNRRYEDARRKYIRKEEYVNNKPLDYSKIKHKQLINTRPKKTLTKSDEMEAAYDNFEKIYIEKIANSYSCSNI